MQTILHALIILFSLCVAIFSFRPFYAMVSSADRRRVVREIAYIEAFQRLNWVERFFWPVPIGVPASNKSSILLATLFSSAAMGYTVYVILCMKVL